MKFDKVYYTRLFFEQVLPQIEKITTQSKYGYHGLSHTCQVAMFAIDIAQHINQDALPVLLAAGLHDCARTNDEWCTEHGPQAAIVGREFLAQNYKNIPQKTAQQILFAIENHTTGRIAPDGVSACLWDGDRIRLSWENGFRPEFFNTARGREIAGLDSNAQKIYIAKQNDFLVHNNIKTREQILFERKQDEIQNKIGTEFSCKIK